jgi:protein-tyrosine phosphatase
MGSELYWIPTDAPGRLAIMPRPRGGDWLQEEVRAWRDAGVDVIVSLLSEEEIRDLELAEEQSLCNAQGIEFVAFPITDRGVPPAKDAVIELACKLHRHLVEGKNIAIHCRQGIGRAALIAICVLVMGGLEFAQAVDRVGKSRGITVPETSEQLRWIKDFALATHALATK